MFFAMVTANLWFEGEAATNCTSDPELAREGFETFSPFFDFLGIPRSQKLITKYSAPEEFCFNGINYSDTKNYNLFISKLKISPFFIKEFLNTPISIALDEADSPIFDDRTHYRQAIRMYKLDLKWIYKPIYEFLHSDKYLTLRTVGDVIKALRELLLDLGEKRKVDMKLLKEILASDMQLFLWSKRAFSVDSLIEGLDYKCCEEKRGIGDNEYPISFARLYDKQEKIILLGQELGGGAQQFLHVRLNKEVVKERQIPEFPVDPETVPVSSIDSNGMLDFHTERGRIIAGTGSSGSVAEREQARARHQLEFVSIPSHQVNKREYEPSILTYGEKAHFEKIIESILQHVKYNESWWAFWRDADPKPQPILVAFDDIPKSQRFYKFLHEHIEKDSRFKHYKEILHSQLYNSGETKSDGLENKMSAQEVVSRAGVAGCITVSTIIKRGNDIKPRLNFEDNEQNHPRGLFVLKTYVASERDAIQIDGRSARLDHPGQVQFVADQNEFESLSISYLQKQSLGAVKILQETRAKSEETKRIHAERSAMVKTHFFDLYTKLFVDEKEFKEDMRKAWAVCLKNIDDEWTRLLGLHKHTKLNDKELRDKLTPDLVKNTCADWNRFVPKSYFQKPDDVLLKIKKRGSKDVMDCPEEEFAVERLLQLDDVCPAQTYASANPLSFTIEPDDQIKKVEVTKFIQNQKRFATYERLTQLLNNPINDENFLSSLEIGLKKVITSAWTDKSPIGPVLNEIFAITKSSDELKLQQELSRLINKTFYGLAYHLYEQMRLSTYFNSDSFPRVNLSFQKKDGSTTEYTQLQAMIEFLKSVIQMKRRAQEAQNAEMGLLALLNQNIVEPAKKIIFGDDILILERLIEFIDTPIVSLTEDEIQAASSFFHLIVKKFIQFPCEKEVIIKEPHEEEHDYVVIESAAKSNPLIPPESLVKPPEEKFFSFNRFVKFTRSKLTSALHLTAEDANKNETSVEIEVADEFLQRAHPDPVCS